MKYPKITKENFEEMINKIVVDGKLTVEPPKNDREFGEATKNLYGVRLHVDCMAYGLGSFNNHEFACKYEIKEYEDDYKKGEIYRLWEKKFSQYDGLKPLLKITFGETFCGGVSSHHYAQTYCDKETWERVRNWNGESANKQKRLKAAVEQHKSLVDIFGFNPFM